MSRLYIYMYIYIYSYGCIYICIPSTLQVRTFSAS